MSPVRSLPATFSASVPSVVVVDPRFDAYTALADSARLGKVSLHLRSSGNDALRLGRRLHVDAWLVAADLDDMSGHDFVELLRSESHESPIAMLVDTPDGRRNVVASSEALEAGADAALARPISLADLERLIGLPSEERLREFSPGNAPRSFVTLPVGVGAAVIAVAVLMMG